MPTQIIFETSAACNLRCKGCAIHGPRGIVNRPIGVMKTDIWQSALREIGGWNVPLTISLHGGGEPLLHPEFAKILRLTRSYPKLNAGFLTNGVLFSEKWAHLVVDEQIDWVAFSVDGVVPETFAQIRKGADLELVEKNINYIIELKKKLNSLKPNILLNMVAYDEILDQKDAFIDKWVRKVGSVMVSNYRNPPSSRRWPGVNDERRPCQLLWSQIVISWDGRIGLCCEDFNIDVVLGKVGEDTILNSWNGERINSIRKAHNEGHFDDLLLCRNCDTWDDDSFTTETDIEKQCQIVKRISQESYQCLKSSDM